MGLHILSRNKRAVYEYSLDDKYEAGIVLNGLQVRTVKTKGMNISEGFVRIENDEAWLWNSYVGEDSVKKKLLLHKDEIKEISKRVHDRSWTAIPLEVGVNNHGVIKVNIALARGKKKYDKREAEKRKTIAKELQKMV